MKRTKMKRLVSIVLAVLVIMSVGCVSVFAKAKSADVGTSAVEYTADANEKVVVYDFPYYDASTPQIEGKTLAVYSEDGVYIGETTPLKKIGTFKSSPDNKTYNTYRCTINNQPIYFQDFSYQPIYPNQSSAKEYGFTLEPNAFHF